MKTSVDIFVELSQSEKDILLDAIAASLKEYKFVRGGENLRTIQEILAHNNNFVLKLPEIYLLIEILEAHLLFLHARCHREHHLICQLNDISELKTGFNQILEEQFNLGVKEGDND